MMYKNGRKWVNLITLLITRKDNVAQNLLFMRVSGCAKFFESHVLRHNATVILIELRWHFSMPENRLK